jgi:Fic family protein
MNTIEKLKLLQELTGKSQANLAVDLSVTFSTFNSWILGKSLPRIKHVHKIDTLLTKYGVQASTKSKIDTQKKLLLSLTQKQLKLREDIIGQLSLLVTYNTNAIEGNTLTLKDTTAILVHKKNLLNKTNKEQLEAINHDKALRFMIEYVSKKGKINEKFILTLHKILMGGILQNAGEYRNHNVRIVGTYIPTANYLKIQILLTYLYCQQVMLIF